MSCQIQLRTTVSFLQYNSDIHYLLHLEAQLSWGDFTIGVTKFVDIGN